MKSKQEIQKEADEIYEAILHLMKSEGTDYVKSWWLNPRNTNLESKLSTQEINQRCRLLVKQEKLMIDHTKTSTSNGTRYKLKK